MGGPPATVWTRLGYTSTRPDTVTRLGYTSTRLLIYVSILTKGNPLIWPMGHINETSRGRVDGSLSVPDQLISLVEAEGRARGRDQTGPGTMPGPVWSLYWPRLRLCLSLSQFYI